MLRALSSLLVLLALAQGARAQAPAASQDQCAEAYVAAQRARQVGKLREARAQALFCAREGCSHLLRGDCVRWSQELDAQIPSVVLDARYEDGGAPERLSVRIDGADVPAVDLARAIPLDPGEHRFEVQADGEPAFLTVRVVEGLQGQPVVVRLVRARVDPPAPERVTSRRAGAALLGVGAAALATFGALAITGAVRERDLEERCAPDCARSRAAPIERLYLAADLSLGLSLVSGGTGFWLWWRGRSERPRGGRVQLDRLRVGSVDGAPRVLVRARF